MSCSVLGTFDIISFNLHTCSTLVPTFLMVQVRQGRGVEVEGLHGQSWLQTHALCTLTHCLPRPGHTQPQQREPGRVVRGDSTRLTSAAVLLPALCQRDSNMGSVGSPVSLSVATHTQGSSWSLSF